MQYALVSGIWITHVAWTLNNTKWFFRNATEAFQFPSPEFSGMINWKLFKWSPQNVTLNQGTKTTRVTGFTEVSSSVTNKPILHALKLKHCPASRESSRQSCSISLCYTKNPTWEKSSWRSVKRRRGKSNRLEFLPSCTSLQSDPLKDEGKL